MNKIQAYYMKSSLLFLLVFLSHQIGGIHSNIKGESSKAVVNVRKWVSQSLTKSEEALGTINQWISDSRTRNERRAFIKEAVQLFHEKEYTEAIHRFSRAIDLKPNAYYYRMRGNCHSEAGNYTNAISDYREAVSKNDETARILLCQVLFHIGQRDTAITEMLDLDTYDLMALADRLCDNENYDDALCCYDEAIRRTTPREPVYYRNRGSCYRKMGKLDKAIEDFKEVMAIEPEFIYSKIELCEMLLEDGKSREARNVLKSIEKEDDPLLDRHKDRINDLRQKIEKAEKAKKEVIEEN